MFTRQKDRLDLLETGITKSEVQAMFERIFFSDKTRRLDLCLTLLKHSAEKEQVRPQNNTDQFYSTLKRRRVEAASITEFKKECGLHPNVIKTNLLTRGPNASH